MSTTADKKYLQTMSSQPVKYIIAYDVEATGQSSTHHMVELGAVFWKVGEETPRDTFYAYLGLDGEWCERTKREFWDNTDQRKDGKTPLQALKERLDAEAPKQQTEEEVANAFVKWARERNKEVEGDVILVSDTGGFDYLRLSILLEKCTGVAKDADYPDCFPMGPLYLFGKYRPTRDTSSFMMGAGGALLKWSSKERLLGAIGEIPKWVTDFDHSHHPLDDACSIAATFSWVLTELANMEGKDTASETKKRKKSP